MPTPVVVVDFDEPDPLLEQVQQLICKAPAITVVCGAGVSTSAGIKDFRSNDGIYHQEFHVGKKTLPGSQLFSSRTLRDPELTFLMNRVLLDMRVSLRTAQPTAFHRLIAAMHSFSRLVQCYTQNIDGLQTRDNPGMEDVVFELHGTNRKLQCRECWQEPEHSPEDFDHRLRTETQVACPSCLSKEQSRLKSGKRPHKVGCLVPAILFNEDSCEGRKGQDFSKMIASHAKATDLLIIAGTSLRTDGTNQLIRDMAKIIHQHKGLVIYINREKPSSDWDRHLDLYMETDIEYWAGQTFNRYLQVTTPCTKKAFYKEAAKLVEKLRTGITSKPSAIGERRSLTKDPNIAQSILEHNFRGSVTVEPPMETTKDTPTQPNSERSEAGDSDGLPNQRKRSGTVSHRLQAQHGVSPPASTPSVVLVVFRSGTPEAIAASLTIAGIICSQWTRLGWKCCQFVVPYEEEINSSIPFEKNQYHIVMVHITEYLDVLVAPATLGSVDDDVFMILAIGRHRIRKLLPGSLSRCAIVICSDTLLRHADEVQRLEIGIKYAFPLDHVLCTLALKSFVDKDWGKFMAKATALLLGEQKHRVADVVKAWMANTQLMSASNLLWLSPHGPTLLLLASPFTDRPCGRQLPDINLVCYCHVLSSRPPPKTWLVKHNCQNRMDVRDVVLDIKCSACQRQWDVTTADMSGILVEESNLFAVVAPYFV